MKPLARWNTGLATLLVGMVVLRLLLWPMAHPACAGCGYRSVDRPLWCDRISGLAVTYVNGGTDPPAAFQETTGTFDGDTAYFRVYALSNEPRGYADVTSEYRFRNHPDRPRVIRVRVRPAPGSHDVSGTVGYSNHSNENRIYYRPKHPYHLDRVALITFEYHCICPTARYRATFALKIPAQAPAGAPGP